MTAVAERPRTKKKRGGGAPKLDPVTRYAHRVLDGKIVSGLAVRQACQRHLTDLARASTRAFPYYFDPHAAQHVIDFFPRFLTLENGAPFRLPEWLQFCYGSIYGWKRVDGDLRKYQYGFFETSKGSGKTPSAGGIGLYGMMFDDEPYGEIYSAAFDKSQASIILNDAIRMASNSEDLADILTIDKYNILHDESGSFFRAVSSEHRGKSGPRPYYVLGDEIHEHRDGRVLNKLLAGFKGRTQPLALLYTNSGSDRTSICWEYHQKSLAVLEGTVTDEQWFGYVCHLDACPKCYDEGYRQPKDGCPNCDDWTDPAVWLKVAPALGVVIQPKYMQDAVDAALSLPSEFALKRRLNFCIWTETHQTWINAQKWDACKAPSLVIPGAHVSACAAAFDMSEKLDLTAGVFAQRVDDDPKQQADQVEMTTVEDGKEVTQTLNLNFRVVLTPYFWIPEETMLARIDTERIPYDAWRRREGSRLEVTTGPIIDHDLIFERFKNTLAPKFKPTIVGYDPHNAVQFGAALRDRGKFNAVEVPQGRRLSEAFKWFEALVMSRRIMHDGDPVLGWCVANCEAKRDRYRNMWVEKPSATKRIDGAMAAVMALHLLQTMPRAPKPRLLIIGGGGGRRR